jgi:hypothetical protein
MNVKKRANTVLYVFGLGLWCVAPLSTIFQIYRGGQFYWWRKKPPTCCKSLTDLSHNVASSTSRLSGIRTHSFSGDRH